MRRSDDVVDGRLRTKYRSNGVEYRLRADVGVEAADGLFGELFATALEHRGVSVIVMQCGIRDTAELRT